MGYADRGRLTIGIIEALKNQGLNQSEIAALFNVTKQAVSYHKKTYNGSRTPREEVMDCFPWQLDEEQGKTSAVRRLRDHGEYMATDGRGMGEDKLSRLRSWYQMLRDEDVVVEFDPNIPPLPGVALSGGFAYRQRKRVDSDLLIRVNDHTTLTVEGRLIWRFPPKEP